MANLWANITALWRGPPGNWQKTVKINDPENAKYFRMSDSIVTPETALKLSTAWDCVRLKSETCGTFPLNVMKSGDKSGGWSVRASDHPLWRIVHTKPNDSDMTAATLWVSTFAALDLAGNAFHEKITNGDRIVALEWLNPFMMRDAQPNRDGSIDYLYSDPVTRTQRRIKQDRVIHYKQFSNGGRYGVSAIAAGARALSQASAIELAATATFANGIRPGGYITTGGKTLTDPQREEAKRNLIEDMQGIENAGKWKLLEGTFDVKPFEITPEDAQMLDSRKWSVEDICRFFGVPPVLVGHSAPGQTMWGTGIEQLLLGWQTLRLRPFVTNVEKQATIGMLSPAEIETGIKLEFNMDAMFRADAATKATLMGTLVDKGLRTRNEVRAIDNYPPMDGGNELTVQMQMVPLRTIGERPTTPTPFGNQPGAKDG